MGLLHNHKNSMPEQVEENKQNINTLEKYIKKAYKANSSTMTPQDTTIDISNTTINDGATEGFLISENGLLFNIVGVEQNVVYIYFWADLASKVAGPEGASIVKIEKTETQGLIDTYTITMTNGETFTFDVTNGEGFNYMGDWVSDNEYFKNDVVSYEKDGATDTYILIADTLVGSITPPSEDLVNWKLFVSAGTSTGGGIQSITVAAAALKTSLSNLVKAGHTIISLEFEDKTGNINISQQALTLNTDGTITAGTANFSMPKSLIFTPSNIIYNGVDDVYYVNMASAYGPEVYTLVMSSNTNAFSAPLSIQQVGATSFRIGGQFVTALPNNLGSNNFVIKYI